MLCYGIMESWLRKPADLTLHYKPQMLALCLGKLCVPTLGTIPVIQAGGAGMTDVYSPTPHNR